MKKPKSSRLTNFLHGELYKLSFNDGTTFSSPLQRGRLCENLPFFFTPSTYFSFTRELGRELFKRVGIDL